LPIILGSSLLPNSKGRARFALDQGAGLISSAVFSATTVGAIGGAQTTTLSSIHVPPVKITDPGHNHTALQPTQTRNDGTSVASLFAFATSQNTSTNTTGITAGTDKGMYLLTGKLTIKNIVREIKFPFVATADAEGYILKGSFKIKRKDFGVGGTSTIANELEVNLNVHAIPASNNI